MSLLGTFLVYHVWLYNIKTLYKSLWLFDIHDMTVYQQFPLRRHFTRRKSVFCLLFFSSNCCVFFFPLFLKVKTVFTFQLFRVEKSRLVETSLYERRFPEKPNVFFTWFHTPIVLFDSNYCLYWLLLRKKKEKWN